MNRWENVLVIILALLVLCVPFSDVLIIEEFEGYCQVYELPNDDQVSISTLHSLSQTEIKTIFEAVEETLVVLAVEFVDQGGAGMPDTLDAVHYDGKLFIGEIERTYEVIDMTVQPNSETIIEIGNYKINLSKDVTSVNFYSIYVEKYSMMDWWINGYRKWR